MDRTDQSKSLLYTLEQRLCSLNVCPYTLDDTLAMTRKWLETEEIDIPLAYSMLFFQIWICICVSQGLCVCRSNPAEGLHTAAPAGQQQGEEGHRSGRQTEAWRHQPGIIEHVSKHSETQTAPLQMLNVSSDIEADSSFFRLGHLNNIFLVFQY